MEVNEYRISFNPYTKDYISGQSPHSIAIYNHHKQAKFEEYIRGIIFNEVLYLRIYYPFPDLQEKTLSDILKASETLLRDNKRRLIRLIKAKDSLNIKEVRYNVTNDLLSGLKLSCI